MNNYFIIGILVVSIYLIFNWLKNKYFSQSRYFKASKFILLAVLVSLFFSKKLFEDFKNKDYFYLTLFAFLIGYFVYSFIIEVKKVKSSK